MISEDVKELVVTETKFFFFFKKKGILAPHKIGLLYAQEHLPLAKQHSWFQSTVERERE